MEGKSKEMNSQFVRKYSRKGVLILHLFYLFSISTHKNKINEEENCLKHSYLIKMRSNFITYDWKAHFILL
ncbi:hypothetical protein C0J52_24206 [Blattella germanica]|nr:hypothetical protein C0J52_24206 [Blattella germanica]